ncbi:MAG: sensor histidine kinase RegB [Albidovulum sp.]
MNQPADPPEQISNDEGVADLREHGDWISLRTLVLLRWTAIIGQASAILVAWRYYEIDLDIMPCLLVVGAAAAVNLLAALAYPGHTRLSDRGAMLTLLFDTSQLALLLALTGGLNNPFALLILAPATIAATALHARATIFVGVVTITLVTIIAFVHVPLRTRTGETIVMPPVFGFGFWLAIVIGVTFLGLYARRVATEIRMVSDALLATQMALAREQKLTDLGGVIAAAAHELGTPLATIKLTSAELVRELADNPELRADAELIREQADRCRDILRSMGRAGKSDLLLRSAPLAAVIREAAEPHLARGKMIHFDLGDAPGNDEGHPQIYRKPEIVHGLRNFIQNAVDFARSAVWVDADWSERDITITIVDDGDGFPINLIGRIGDPFLPRRRDDHADCRPEYDGMGLGLFIAKTLLERTGAKLRFSNGSDPFLTEEERPARSGAVVTVTWPRSRLEVKEAGGLGENRRIIP